MHFDYTSDNVRFDRPHLNKHRTTQAAEVDPLDGFTLGEIRQQLATLDEWKARATAAERSLPSLRDALREVAS